MSHHVTINDGGDGAKCSCGYSCITLAGRHVAEQWRDQHLSEFGIGLTEPRHALSGSLLADATDDQLRAECKRRDLKVIEWDAVKPLIAERDEWKRRAETAEANMAVANTAATPKLAPIDSPRAAGATLISRVSRRLTMPACGDRTESPHGHYVCSEIDYRNPERPVLKFVKTDPPRSVESGPGLAAQRPDNSIAHLPEDLLCEDA